MRSKTLHCTKVMAKTSSPVPFHFVGIKKKKKNGREGMVF
jgi:hypothetical protein